jgi:WS/DGAT/MGAT family acyltransferase
MVHAEKMSNVDRAWLRMERPSNPMVVMGLLVLARPLAYSALRQLLADRFLRFDRFRCIPRSDALAGRWMGAEHFNLDDHLFQSALPAPAGRRELEILAGELASTPFSPGRPAWSFHLVPRYLGGSALIVRIHHAYADGVALMHVLATLADEAPAADLPPTGAAAATPIRSAAGSAPTGIEYSELIEKTVHLALHPLEAVKATQDAVSLAGEIARLGLLMADDPATRLKQTLCGVKHVAWGEPLDLEEVHTVGRVLGCTVNDVLIATLAGGIGRYLDARGERTAGISIRAAAPVNLRPPGDSPLDLGNRFGLAFVDLPIGIRHPLERLYAVHTSMQALKASPQAWAVFELFSLVGSLPAAVEDAAIAWFGAKASLVASNLRGPDRPLHLAGIPIAQLLFWVPQTGDIGLGVSMFTYQSSVQFGVIADRSVVPDPGELVEITAKEFDRLVLLVLLGGGSLVD